ncbi:hypothetical protein D3C73_1263950 [compost metagenome]
MVDIEDDQQKLNQPDHRMKTAGSQITNKQKKRQKNHAYWRFLQCKGFEEFCHHSAYKRADHHAIYHERNIDKKADKFTCDHRIELIERLPWKSLT